MIENIYRCIATEYTFKFHQGQRFPHDFTLITPMIIENSLLLKSKLSIIAFTTPHCRVIIIFASAFQLPTTVEWTAASVMVEIVKLWSLHMHPSDIRGKSST